MRHALSISALALMPVLVGVTQGCGDESQPAESITQPSDYQLNSAAANELTPLHGETINIIPFSNEDGVVDASGALFARGDQEIAKVFGPGQIGISLEQRADTHVQLVVGVEKAEHGKPGAITLNSPQGYEDGRFGDPLTTMVLLRPVYPAYAASRQQDYQANTLASLMMLNAAMSCNDPASAHDPVATYVDQAVRAIAGDADAQAWFQDPDHCAEAAFIALSAGILEPLTADNLVPRVGEDMWAKFVEQVAIHNRGVDEFQQRGSISEENTSNFLRLNDNQRVGMVRIALCEGLPPIYELASNPAAEAEKIAALPMTIAAIAETGGLLDLQYEGHGVHVTATQKRAEIPVDDFVNDVSCRISAQHSNGEQSDNSCGLQAPGGCWCDDYCRTAGDCCADARDVCSF